MISKLDRRPEYIQLRIWSEEDHAMHLRIVLQTLERAPVICQIFRNAKFWLVQVAFLGHVVFKDGIQVDPNKIEAIIVWPSPTTVTEVRSFLGFASYYRRLVKDFSKIAASLTRLTQKNVKLIGLRDVKNISYCLRICWLQHPC